MLNVAIRMKYLAELGVAVGSVCFWYRSLMVADGAMGVRPTQAPTPVGVGKPLRRVDDADAGRSHNLSMPNSPFDTRVRPSIRRHGSSQSVLSRLAQALLVGRAEVS
jgi:hypothetical protein